MHSPNRIKHISQKGKIVKNVIVKSINLERKGKKERKRGKK